METKWFDDLTRAIAPPVSRRHSLKILGGSLASRLLTLLGISLGVAPSRASADERPTHPDITLNTVELLPYQNAGYRFQIISLDAAPPSGWEQPEFNGSGFQFGQAAFGSGGDCPLQSTIRTMWPSNSQLLVQTVVSIPIEATDLRIMVSVDNDIVGVFFDGQVLPNTSISHEECPIQDEFRFDVPSSLATPGDKLVAFHVLDRGEEAFFDARILAEVPRRIFAKDKCDPNNFVTVPCTELLNYFRDCGYVCPDGLKKEPITGETMFPVGCTSFSLEAKWKTLSTEFGSNFLGQVCASSQVTADWPLDQDSSVIQYSPEACCEQECKAEIDEVTRQIEAHEACHRMQCEDAVAKAKRAWAAPRRFTACAGTAREARKALTTRIKGALQDDYRIAYATCNMEPPPRLGGLDCTIRPFKCGKCITPKPGQICKNGQCSENSCSQTGIWPNPVFCPGTGNRCVCLRTVEGDLRCGGDPHFFCVNGAPCVTSAGCEQWAKSMGKGSGWFCQAPGTGGCGCAQLPSGGIACGEAGFCVPPCKAL